MTAEADVRAGLVGMATGFFRGKVLCAAVRLGVADALSEPMSPAALATAIDADADALDRLLRALAAIGIVQGSSDGRYGLTGLGESLRRDATDSAWASVIFWADLLADQWTYLDECVRAGERERPARARQQEGIKSRWSVEPDPTAIFHAVFAEAGAEENRAYVEAIDVSSSQVVADLGGGGGGLLSAVLTAAPRLRGVLVDRPGAVEGAVRRIETLGLQDRCEIRSGDLVEDVPVGADTYLMRSVLHGYDDDSARMILANCRAAIPDDGRLLVIESVMPDYVEAADAAVERLTMGDLNMLAVTGGRERTHAEWESLLNASGFDVLATRPVPDGASESPTNWQHRVIEARPRR